MEIVLNKAWQWLGGPWNASSVLEPGHNAERCLGHWLHRRRVLILGKFKLGIYMNFQGFYIQSMSLKS